MSISKRAVGMNSNSLEKYKKQILLLNILLETFFQIASKMSIKRISFRHAGLTTSLIIFKGTVNII